MLDLRLSKKFFFDRRIVIDAVSKNTRSALSRAGAFVRRRAKSLIRKRKRASEPGQPPSSHVGDLRRLILFAFDPVRRAVIVGAAKFNAKAYVNGRLTAGTVPATLEYGGQVGLREKQLRTGAWVSIGRNKLEPGQPTRVRMATYAPRPHMTPALQAELPNIPQQFRGLASIGPQGSARVGP